MQSDVTAAVPVVSTDRRERQSTYVLKLALVMLGAAAVALLRLSPLSRDTVWAEDGTVFLEDAIERSPLHVLDPYAGYLHFAPRVIAQFVVAFSAPQHYALSISIGSCLALGCIAALTYHCSQAVTRSTTVRLAFASIPALVAPGALETAGNLANLHWYLLWLMPWLLLKPAVSRAEGVLLFSVAATSALTEIQTLLFLPLLLLCLRSKKHLPAAAGLLMGGAAQAYTTLRYPRPDEYNYDLNWLSVPYGYALNASSSLVYGTSTQIGGIINRFGPAPIICAFLLLALPVWLVLRYGSRRQQLIGLVFVGASVIVWSASQILNPTARFDYAEFEGSSWLAEFYLSRYTTTPAMFLLACFPLAVATLHNRPSLKVSSLAPLLLGVFVALQLVYFFPPESSRSVGPGWSEQFKNARAECESGAEFTQVLTAPSQWEPVLLECPIR